MSYRDQLLTDAAIYLRAGAYWWALGALKAALSHTPKGKEWAKIMLAIKMTRKAMA